MAKFIKIHTTYEGNMYETYVNTDKIKMIFIEGGYTKLNISGLDYNLYSDQTPQEILQMIDEQPTVEAEPVLHGTWKPVSEDWRHQIEWWECSECNFSASTKYNYCPNCGAKMDAE